MNGYRRQRTGGRASRRRKQAASFDFAEAQGWAAAVLGIAPPDFWALTYSEYQHAHAAWSTDEKRKLRQEFTALSYVLTALTHTQVTVAQLMGEDEPSKEATRAELSEGEKRMKQILRAHRRREKQCQA